MTSRYFPALIALVLMFSIFPVLGLPQIWGSSEARETHVASIIRDSNEWILPERNGFVPSKPLLHHWLVVVTSFLTGQVDEFSSRFPSALLGILSVLALSCFSRSLFSVNPRTRDRADFHSFCCIFILVTSYGFFRMLFNSMVDMTFAALAGFALLSILSSIFRNILAGSGPLSIGQKEWTLFFLLCGLATLAKGPLGLLLPCLMLGSALWSLVGLREALTLAFKPKWGWAVYLIIALPWYFLAQTKSESSLLERQLLFENIERFFGGEKINVEPFWYYFPSFIVRAAPWSLIFIGLVYWLIFYQKKTLSSVQPAARRINFSLLASIGSAVLFFSIASGKRHSYLLPIFPLLAFSIVWLGTQWVDTVDKVTFKRCVRWGSRSLFGLVCLLLVFETTLMLFAYLPTQALGERPGLVIASEWVSSNGFRLFLAPTLAFTLWMYCRLRHLAPELVLFAKLFVLSACFASIISFAYGVRGSFRDYKGMAEEIVVEAAGREIVAVRDRYDELLDPIFYYLKFPIQVVDPKELKLACAENKVLITRTSSLDHLPKEIKIQEEKLLREKVGRSNSVNKRAISMFHCMD